MNRNEFMEQLRRLLCDIPAQDREEALEYYESYFDDAGTEREEEVIRELGSPEHVAAEIKAGLNPDMNAGEYTDTGYHNSKDKDRTDYPSVKGKGNHRTGGMDDGMKKILFIVILVLSLPLWGSILGTVFSVIMGLIGTLISLLAGTLAGGIVSIACGLALIVIGMMHMVISIPLGIAALGVGMVSVAIGILLLICFGWLVSTAVPAIIRFVSDLIRNVISKIKGVLK